MTKLKIGKIAPNIKLMDWKGNMINLWDIEGPKWVAFFRYASCPLCNLRVNTMIKRYEELTKNGLKILAIFQSTPISIAEYVGKQAPPFTILCDPKEEFYKVYGLQTNFFGMLAPENITHLFSAMKMGFKPGRMEGSLTRIPADFLLDDENIISDTFYGKTIGDHIPIERVLKFINSKGM